MAFNEATKNHQGGGVKDSDTRFTPRIYATNVEMCSFASMKKYMEKTNKGSYNLFQQPKRTITPNDKTWYTTRPVGERTLNDMMKTISTEAG
ncbi:hypothetical protein KUTeg_005467 [Tegillarca granosa]|uniref:DUF3504 domain-containing protein n=1 Tax=Tegillarca granosa TaxID=220873 RepID=A0ABQ9FPC7_TEGGR|nr:hypothetical protein KUTeg_005467 [Tegillarca granosa]